jgi:hypothetical protein
MTFVDNIFYKITAEMASNYEFKHDLIRGYILELIHYALKMKPSERLYDQIDAKTRITYVFNELLKAVSDRIAGTKGWDSKSQRVCGQVRCSRQLS